MRLTLPHHAPATLLAVPAALLSVIAPASAQQWPTKQAIKIVVPNTPGAGVDNGARLLAERFREGLGQTVIVENRPGANTVIGTAYVAKSAPDGYTLLFVANAHVIVPLVSAKPPYDAIKDFTPIATLAYTPYMMLVNPSIPVNTPQQFVAYAKARQGQLNFGSAGVGAGSHMAGEVFLAMTGVKMQHIPYKGGGEALTALMSGLIHASWNSVNAGAPHVKSGRLKALAVSGEARAPALPDVPTFTEIGMPDYQERAWLGLLGPASMARPIVDRLNAETARVLRSPGIKENFDPQGLVPFQTTPDQFTEMLKRETANYAPIVKAANIRIE